MKNTPETYYIANYNEALYLIGTKMLEIANNSLSRLVKFISFDKSQTYIYGWEISNVIYKNKTDYLINHKLFCDAIKEFQNKKLTITSVVEPQSDTLSSFLSEKRDGNHTNQEENDQEWFELSKKYPVANFQEINKELTVSFKIIDKKGIEILIQKLETQFNSTTNETTKNDNFNAPKNKETLFIKLSGELWRHPKEKYCYPIEENSNRHKIILCLINKKDFCKTEEITIRIGKKNNPEQKQIVRKTIADIKKQIKKRLEIEDFITYKRESGYKLNYTIVDSY